MKHMRMQHIHHLGAAAALAVAAVWSPAALAQASSPSRAEVKAETRQAVKDKATTPAGEGVAGEAKAPDMKTSRTRAERKAQTRADRKEGNLAAAGPAPDYPKNSKSKGTKTRAERKAETAQARKEGKLAPAGEGSAAPAK